ncbi:NAD(+)--rifampin ADP-ribosyltransferase [Pelagibacterium luteolum]|uniref:Rifampin ADP-ribosylating transferase n=1 Tax=Pelagibacterium luteolum TaxID=440168 RepID=A0A1G7TKM5_9HYPH|nr:NAD(+)--rifampin ADP-ribosyltransferase [Pelagibacterium luteolum]SDG35574.1 rifampin ADP-ribosylating transferase [Pelagibacterium luteolum]
MGERYYHGGFGGLRVGMYVLPPSITKAASTADFGAGTVCRKDRVYITSRFENAMEAAAMHPSGRGRVYEVEPIGEIAVDPDSVMFPGQDPWSWECERAVVVAIHKLRGKDIKRIKKLVGAEFGVLL